MKHVLVFILLFCFARVSSQTFITSDVTIAFKNEPLVDCIIEMQDQWIAPEFINSWVKEEKGTYVFNHLKKHAQHKQKEIIHYFKSNDISFKSFYVFNGLQVTLNKDQLNFIANNFDISKIMLNQSSLLQLPRNQTSSNRMETEWGITKIVADSVWQQGFEGQEVVIAGQDTGYDFENEFIVDRYRGTNNGIYDHNYNWHDAVHSLSPLHNDPDTLESNNPCGLDSEFPCDDHGHGTHTMGTMVGQNPEFNIGVAPQASWIACRNMDRGWGSPTTYTECFEFFLAPTDLNNENPDPTMAPHVINNSWGCPEIEGCNSENWTFMETVINNLTAAGVVVVVSAGNDGSNGCGSINRPASMFEQSFVVGASDDQDTIAGFSSFGPVNIDGSGRWKPDVVAPGVDVRSITLDGFGTWSGTSMAGPHVAGAVALIISSNPALAGQVEEIKNLLRNTAVPLTDTIVCDGISADQIPNFRYGYGRIDVYAAVKAAEEYVGISQSPQDSPFAIYPNPASTQISISTKDNDSKILNISIYSADGKLQFKSKTRYIVNIQNLELGYHILQITSNTGVYTLPFVKWN